MTIPTTTSCVLPIDRFTMRRYTLGCVIELDSNGVSSLRRGTLSKVLEKSRISLWTFWVRTFNCECEDQLCFM